MTEETDAELRWHIAPLQIRELPKLVAVTSAGVTVGRDSSNDVVVPTDTFPGVSAHHARFVLDGDDLAVEDLGSTNGVIVGGKAVRRRTLVHGSEVLLGADGPRFVAVLSGDDDLADTVDIPREAVVHGKRSSIGSETMMLLREQLGIPQDKRVDQMVRRRSRRNLWIGAVAFLLLASGAYFGFRFLRGEGKDAVASLEAKTEELERQFDEELKTANAALNAQRDAWADQRTQLDDARSEWERHKIALERERRDLVASIDRIEVGIAADEEAAAGQLARLRRELEDTTNTLESYNPLNLEMARLREVSRIERSVVLIEARQLLVDEETGKTLYLDAEDAGQGFLSFNLEERGEPLVQEATGSGFCASADGWIVTNAHVVFEKNEDDDPIDLGNGHVVMPRTELTIVFSGQEERHAAEIVRVSNTDKQDLALLKIEPFEGMPHLDGLDLEAPRPQRGTEVFLLGFPLGTSVLQEGDRVIASAFRGIVSRGVDYYLQVDAAVHPGASGGPVIDGVGRLIGVVVGMQAVTHEAESSAIGYIIPIDEAAEIWPPPEEHDGR